jgi:hypothetical protein
MITINYPNWIDECGEYIGALRQISNYNKTMKFKKYDRGSLNNTRNQLGVKGELIFALFCERNSINYVMPELWSEHAVSSYDFKIKGKSIDVKTTASPNIIAVNKEEHDNKNKGIQIYVFIQLVGNNIAHMHKYSYEDVSKWECIRYGYTDAYILNLKK